MPWIDGVNVDGTSYRSEKEMVKKSKWSGKLFEEAFIPTLTVTLILSLQHLQIDAQEKPEIITLHYLPPIFSFSEHHARNFVSWEPSLALLYAF